MPQKLAAAKPPRNSGTFRASSLSNIPDNIAASLDLLQDSLAEEVTRINEEGSKAMRAGDYPTAKEVLAFALRLEDFGKRVKDLNTAWSQLKGLSENSSSKVQQIVSEKFQQIVSRRFFGRESNGEITPQTAFFRPVLEALLEREGSGEPKQIIERVGEMMKSRLMPKDFEKLLSDGRREARWRVNVRYARKQMVDKFGYMKKGSPRGIWEVSDEGRKWLK
jgi:restriction system protein